MYGMKIPHKLQNTCVISYMAHMRPWKANAYTRLHYMFIQAHQWTCSTRIRPSSCPFLNNIHKYYHLQNDVLYWTTFLHLASFLYFAYPSWRFYNSNKLDVRGSVHHSTNHKEKSNKIQKCIKLLLFQIYMKLNMFRATHCPSSGA